MTKEEILKEVNLKHFPTNEWIDSPITGGLHSVEKKKVILESMETYASLLVKAALEDLKKDISSYRFMTYHPDTRQVCSNIIAFINQKLKQYESK